MQTLLVHQSFQIRDITNIGQEQNYGRKQLSTITSSDKQIFVTSYF